MGVTNKTKHVPEYNLGDIQVKAASLTFNVKSDNVTDEMRRIAKSINFGVMYGTRIKR